MDELDVDDDEWMDGWLKEGMDGLWMTSKLMDVLSKFYST